MPFAVIPVRDMKKYRTISTMRMVENFDEIVVVVVSLPFSIVRGTNCIGLIPSTHLFLNFNDNSCSLADYL